jgi:NitT/TauT family transport system substrate-binding protein
VGADMVMTRRTILKGAAGTLALPSLARSQTHGLRALKVGTLKQSAQTPAWLAARDGIFARHGLAVELVEFRNGNEAISAQQGGHVDIIVSIPGTVMTANERGFDLVLICQNEVARRAGPDTGSLQVLRDVCVQRVLTSAGVDPKLIQFQEVPYSAQGDALRSRQIDAVASLDPFGTQLRTTSGKVVAWYYVESVPGQPTGAFYAKRRFVEANAPVVSDFGTAMREAIDYLNADEPRARRLVADYSGLSPELIAQMPINLWSYAISKSDWQGVADMMTEWGGLDRKHDVDEFFSDYVRGFVQL